MSRTVLIGADEATVLRLPDAIEYSEAGIVSRTVLAAGGLRAVLFAFAAGQELTEHTSASRALVLALEGAATFRLGARDFEFRAGDLVHLPPGAPHAVSAQERFAMLLVLQSPPRPPESPNS